MRGTEGEAGTQRRLSINELRQSALANSLLVARHRRPCVSILSDFCHTWPEFCVSAPEGSTSNPLYMYLQEGK